MTKCKCKCNIHMLFVFLSFSRTSEETQSMGRPEHNFTTINPLWKTDYTNHTDATIVYTLSSAVSVITSVSGLPLYVYVLWLILRGAGSGIGPEFFTLNLAFIVTGHPLFHTCICVERYLAVLHPVLFLKYKPLRYRLTCSGIIWLMVLMTCMVLVLVEGIIETFWSTLYLIMFVLMLFCCLAVLRGLCKPGPGEGERETKGANQVKMKAFRIILFVTVTQFMIIATTSVSYFANQNVQGLYLHGTNTIIILMMTSASLVHPLLYLHSAGKLHCRASP